MESEDLTSVASRSYLAGTTYASESGSSVDKRNQVSAPVIAKKENQAIAKAKVLIAFVLVLGVAALAATVVLLVEGQENAAFKNQFAAYGSEVINVAEQKADQLFKALDSFSLAISSGAAVKNETWPYVIVDDFSRKAQKLIALSGVGETEMTFCPIVPIDQRENWTTFASNEAKNWYQSSIDSEGSNATVEEYLDKTIPFLHRFDMDNNFALVQVDRPGYSVPIWHSYPLATGMIIPIIDLLPMNFDMFNEASTENMIITSIAIGLPTSDFTPMITDIATEETASLSAILQPVYEGTDSKAEDRKIVGFIWFRLKWVIYLQNVLPKDCNGIIAVIRGSCPIVNVFGDQVAEMAVLSYEINGPDVRFLGPIDAHDPRYDALEVSGVFVDPNVETSAIPEGRCMPRMSLHLYPSDDFKKGYQTDNKYVFGGVVVVVFLFTTLVFLVYDHFVRKRQKKVMDRIMRQDKIVADVFPSAIRDRLYGKNAPMNQLDPMESEYEGNPNGAGDAPMADLFPNTTVVFADIAGFTAWASAREPHQVFILLETIYGAFDKIAYRHSVFKVETVGDCYVAVAGLPEPTQDHAVMACKFARDCLKKMKQITAKLEVELGPDTAELDLRTGIHSGQVTAGVLRGERSRFQLFGDTMNTAARMESSGERNRIQLSQVTASKLREAGLSKLIVARKGKILVKGKGEMQTYWMLAGVRAKSSILLGKIEDDKPEESNTTELTVGSASTAEFEEDFELESEGFEGMSKETRLVAWHVEVLSTLLQQIMASRGDNSCTTDILASSENFTKPQTSVLEEFIPIIPLKRINEYDLKKRRIVSTVAVPEDARSQLKKYISGICGMYRNNAFHNFEHASHVTASVKKLLSRIVNTDNTNGLGRKSSKRGLGMVDLAGHSYGITSDPMTQFAVVFSAIIHDVDHPGVPNTQLVKENTRNAQIYKKSIAEQNSVDLAWEMLMQDEYAALRSCIYQTEEELKRFRQLVVNTVLATDIVDKELQSLRKNRWEAAFSDALSNDDGIINEDRKATIVIEHLIQASDVSHTMQHWQIYKGWNQRFFMECYGGYKAGRADTDPSINWYEGEIGFFDFYVIPLAKKLDSCGVFGVSSDEYLNYAQANRDEWVREGKKLVEEFITKYEETQRSAN